MGDNEKREGRSSGGWHEAATAVRLQKLYQNDKLMLNIQSSMMSIYMKAGIKTS